MGQEIPIPPSILINDTTLAGVEKIKYFGSYLSDKLSLDAAISVRNQGCYCGVKSDEKSV